MHVAFVTDEIPDTAFSSRGRQHDIWSGRDSSRPYLANRPAWWLILAGG
jgi:hypothetical protein